jgi:hypothetical protein
MPRVSPIPVATLAPKHAAASSEHTSKFKICRQTTYQHNEDDMPANYNHQMSQEMHPAVSATPPQHNNDHPTLSSQIFPPLTRLATLKSTEIPSKLKNWYLIFIYS